MLFLIGRMREPRLSSNALASAVEEKATMSLLPARAARKEEMSAHGRKGYDAERGSEGFGKRPSARRSILSASLLRCPVSAAAVADLHGDLRIDSLARSAPVLSALRRAHSGYPGSSVGCPRPISSIFPRGVSGPVVANCLEAISSQTPGPPSGSWPSSRQRSRSNSW